MATTTLRGHVARAMDFFERTSSDVYFCLAQSTAWPDEANPPAPDSNASTVHSIVGFKKVQTAYMVIPDSVNGTISYRDNTWRVVPESIAGSVNAVANIGSTEIHLLSVLGWSNGSLISDSVNTYTVSNVDSVNNVITTSTPLVSALAIGSIVTGGALLEGARWVYIGAYARYDELPLVGYRVLAVFSRLIKEQSVASNKVALLPADVLDVGILEVLDNRKVINRALDQQEMLSVVIEF